MIGKRILHYHILEELGRGGMGVVYKAEDTKLKREVALKFLPANALQGKEEKDRFTREAQAAAALNHPNIAHIYAIEETEPAPAEAGGQMFLAMEFIEGQELVEAIRESPLPIDRAINYATQIAAGLQAAHEKGITHRDIKSANIMVTDKSLPRGTGGLVKIMDFGLAKLADRSGMTQLGTTLGTAAYMSPEQARGEEVDNRSDIWSLGVVLYEMISGQLPFKGDYEQAVIYSIINEEPEPLTALRSGLPIALDGVIAKALSKDPDTRYQHVDELPADLRLIDFLVDRFSRISASDRVQAISVGHQRQWWLRGLAAGLISVVMAIIIWWLATRLSEERPVMRFTMTVPEGTEPNGVAISPDGKRLVYGSRGLFGRDQIYWRTMAERDFELIPGLEKYDCDQPFFSPDGQWLGFRADRKKLMKIKLGSREPVTICDGVQVLGAS